ncbi:MAG: hypothetical protein ACKVON_02670 [Beijerinckiaceae bacterium]
MDKPETKPVPADSTSRQKARSLAIAIGLVCFALLFYFLTIFKMGPAVVNRAL